MRPASQPPAGPSGRSRPVIAVSHLDALRESLGVSVPDLADRICTDRSHLWRVLNGRSNATADLASRVLRELADVLREPAKAGGRG